MSRPSRSTLPRVPALLESDRRDHDDVLARVQRIRQLQQEYAAAIIGAGIFSNDEQWTAAIGTLAEPLAAEAIRALLALMPPDARIPVPLDDDPDSTQTPDGLLMTIANAWGDAGFEVGLAVGMQLGSYAFDTGGAK